MASTERSEKNARIKASLAATKAKRASQCCHVRMLKIQANKLSRDQREALHLVFVEAKWLTNALIAWLQAGNKLDDYSTTAKTVVHRTKDKVEVESEFQHLGSQVRQSVVAGLKTNLKALAVLKSKGRKVGALGFRKECRQLELKQNGVTYALKGSRLKVQGIPGWLRVNGAEQLRDFELANAKLLSTARGYYLAVTCYRDKELEPKPVRDEVGVDFGLETAITLSDGRKFKAKIRESDRLKGLQQRLSRQHRRSKGWFRTKDLLRVEYEKLESRRNDAANKIVHEVKQYRYVYMQDEMIKSWHAGRYSRSVQISVLGRVKAKLKPIATYVLPASVPTTQACYECGCLHEMPVEQRVYTCDCGLPPEDRDVHSAKSMIVFSKQLMQIPVERRESKRGDRSTAGRKPKCTGRNHEAATSLA